MQSADKLSNLPTTGIVLTNREREVLLFLARRCTYEEIALRLGISVHTVAAHLKNCYRKLGVSRAADALIRADALGLLEDR
jgi:DNA-binding CsgD family transcriptional regulator